MRKDILKRMEELIKQLNEAANAYYNSGYEIMSNKTYDDLNDELAKLEQKTGVVLANSPTQKVGYEVVDELPKDKHEFPAKSLDKTKDITEFPPIFSAYDGNAVVMWKMDGSTVVATYDNGALTKLVTRGNGEVGSVITHNAPFIKGLPMKIPFKGHLVVRGEAVMSYAEFERINASLPAAVEQYKNPRNLANATIGLYDSREMSKREIWFHAFKLVYMENSNINTMHEQFKQLADWGFNVVEYEVAMANRELEEVMGLFSQRASRYAFPVDGLVVASNCVTEAEKNAGTGHHPHKTVGYAFKWKDETAETILQKIEWSASRTGLLNPVAVFDPVELEGTTVSRASIHNVSTILNLNLKVGDRILVYKANQIIPQISENLSKTFHERIMPGYIDGIRNCPACGGKTEIVRSMANDSVTLTCHCTNEACPAKLVGKFVHFCERDCMNIEGLSEATIEKFVEEGFLKEFSDLYHLDRYKEQIVSMEGFGVKSYENIIKAVEKSRTTSFVPFIHSLGIPNIGKGQAKLLMPFCHGDVMEFLHNTCNGTDFSVIDGIGEVLELNIHRWWAGNFQSGVDGDNEISRLLKELTFEKTETASAMLVGKTFVITGSLNHYANRDELVSVIEANGGKTSGSVSAKTSFLINNDVTSTSGKNKKAKELGVPIISEEDFLKMLQ